MFDSSQSKVDVIFKKLKLNIINHKYELGEVLNEKSLAVEFNVSKTPVREALSKLVEEGFLSKYPRFGYVVKDLKLNEYYELTQLRRILEEGIIELIIETVPLEKIKSLKQRCSKTYVPFEEYFQENFAFHLEMANLLENPYITDELRRILGWLNRDLSHSFYERNHGDIHINHRQLVEALLERSKEKAYKVLQEELHRSDDPLILNHHEGITELKEK